MVAAVSSRAERYELNCTRISPTVMGAHCSTTLVCRFQVATDDSTRLSAHASITTTKPDQRNGARSGLDQNATPPTATAVATTARTAHTGLETALQLMLVAPMATPRIPSESTMVIGLEP